MEEELKIVLEEEENEEAIKLKEEAENEKTIKLKEEEDDEERVELKEEENEEAVELKEEEDDEETIQLKEEDTIELDYNKFKNKPKINDVELVGNVSLKDLGVQPSEKGKSLVSDEEIEKLSTLQNYDDTEIKKSLNSKASQEYVDEIVGNIESILTSLDIGGGV